jgi:sugar O-acyltransferase (sialic acid O-acetyltransferase NeuD family)
MKNLIIVGSGGLASEIRSYVMDINSHFGNNILIKGIIDDSYENYMINKNRYNFTDSYLGTSNEITFESNDFFVLGFSNLKSRIFYINKLRKLDLNLITLIHPSSIIDKSAIIEEGCIISPFCTIGPNVKIGRNNIFTSYSFVSHDCVVGDNNFFSTAGLAGNVHVGDNNYFGIRATVLPSINVGSNNLIQAGMIVDKNISNNETIYYKYKEKLSVIKEIDSYGK